MVEAAMSRAVKIGLLRVVVSVFAFASTISSASCASKSKDILPLTLLGGDGSWEGTVVGSELRIAGSNLTLHVPQAQNLHFGKTNVLLNSEADGDKYVSLWVNAEACMLNGKTYPYKVTGCYTAASSRYNCVARLDGCAQSKR